MISKLLKSLLLDPVCVVFLSGPLLGISMLTLGLNGCGGGSSTAGLVIPPGYTVTANALTPGTVTAGSKSTSTINLTPVGGYSGTVSLACGMISGGTQAPTCSFSPSAVPIGDNKTGSSLLTVSTLTNTPGGIYAITVNAIDANKLAPSNGARALTMKTAATIQHVVIIFQENRSPDNLFRDPVLISRGADIVGSGKNSLGQTISLLPIDLGTSGSKPQNYDLGHSHSDFTNMYDGGKMDGAELVACKPAAQCPPKAHPNAQFMYVNPSDVQPYFALAKQYTFADRMFQTNQGPSFPAHQFIISGTSAPTATSSLFAAENPTLNNAGCIAPLTTLVTMIDATGSETIPRPNILVSSIPPLLIYSIPRV